MDLARQPAAAPRPPLLHRVTERQLQVLDAVLAGGLMAVVLVHGLHLWATGTYDSAKVATTLVWALAALSIALRRHEPAVSLGLMTAALAVGLGANLPSSLPDLLIAVPMYQMASTRPRRLSLPAVAAELAVLMVVGVLSGDHGRGVALGGAVVTVAAWFVGDSVHVRRVYVAGLAEQAAQRHREAVERAQRSVAEERLQIARELHDVVAHSLSVITIQSGVGRHVIDHNPVEARRALAAVEDTSRAALDELRRMLGVLRGGEPAELAPAPGIAGLPRLVEQVRGAGVPVELDIASRLAGSLSPAAELSVYRIVQEALTNVVKHAGPATAHVTLRDESGELVVEVLDDGLGAGVLTPYPAPPADAGSRHGLVGMRERVALFGGSFAAGPRPEGGFAVHARFPSEAVLVA